MWFLQLRYGLLFTIINHNHFDPEIPLLSRGIVPHGLRVSLIFFLRVGGKIR